MHKAGLQQGIEAIQEVVVRVTQGFDDDIQEFCNLWALDDGADLGDGLEGSLVNLLVRVVQHLPEGLDDVREEAQDLLRSTESHVPDGLDSRELASPVVRLEPFQEHGHDLLDGMVAEVLDDLLVRRISASSDRLSGV